MEPLTLSREGVLSQPLWHNPTHPVSGVQPKWAELWSSLECNVIHNVYSDYESTTPYTVKECAQYLRNNDTYIQFRGEFIPRENFLETWHTIVLHASTMKTKAEEGNGTETTPPRNGQQQTVNEDGQPPEIRITRDGEYYARWKGRWHEAELSYLGTPILGERLQEPPSDLDPAPPAKWGEGYKTNKRLEYPLADEYTLDGKTPLDETQVEHLTEALQRIDRKRKRLTGPTKWEERL